MALIFRLRLFSAPRVSSILYTFGKSSLMLMALICFKPHSVEGEFPWSQEITAEGGKTCSTWSLRRPTVCCVLEGS